MPLRFTHKIDKTKAPLIHLYTGFCYFISIKHLRGCTNADCHRNGPAQGHYSGPARDTMAGQKLTQDPARKALFLYNGRTSFSEEESD